MHPSGILSIPSTLGSYFSSQPSLAGFHLLLRTAETNSPGTRAVDHFEQSIAIEPKKAHMEGAPPKGTQHQPVLVPFS